MKALDYTCRFCGKPGTAQYDDTCPDFRLGIWKKMLACNRCADYRSNLVRCGDRITAACATYYAASMTGKGHMVEPAIREKLNALTQNMARMACDHFRVSRVYDEAFVDILMEKPERSRDIMRTYIRGIRDLSADANGLPMAHNAAVAAFLLLAGII